MKITNKNKTYIYKKNLFNKVYLTMFISDVFSLPSQSSHLLRHHQKQKKIFNTLLKRHNNVNVCLLYPDVIREVLLINNEDTNSDNQQKKINLRQLKKLIQSETEATAEIITAISNNTTFNTTTIINGGSGGVGGVPKLNIVQYNNWKNIILKQQHESLRQRLKNPSQQQKIRQQKIRLNQYYKYMTQADNSIRAILITLQQTMPAQIQKNIIGKKQINTFIDIQKKELTADLSLKKGTKVKLLKSLQQLYNYAVQQNKMFVSAWMNNTLPGPSTIKLGILHKQVMINILNSLNDDSGGGTPEQNISKLESKLIQSGQLKLPEVPQGKIIIASRKRVQPAKRVAIIS